MFIWIEHIPKKKIIFGHKLKIAKYLEVNHYVYTYKYINNIDKSSKIHNFFPT